MKYQNLHYQFEKAVVEEEFYRILNILFFLKAKRSFISLYYGDNKHTCRIIKIDNKKKEVELLVPGFIEGQERRSSITFEALNRYYYSDILITHTENNSVTIGMPEKLAYLRRRLYPRINFDDLFMRFVILFSAVFEKPQEEKLLEKKFPFVYQEIRQENPSLRVIYQMISAEAANISPDFDFVMIKDRKDLSPIEKLVIEDMKNILITDTSRISSYNRPLKKEHIESFSLLYEKFCKEDGMEEADKKFYDLQRDDLVQFIQSYYYGPIKLYDKPIGYLKIQTYIFNKYSIPVWQAEEISALLKLFSYALTKIKMRKTHFDPLQIKTRIVNISMSGLLMEIDDLDAFNYLQKNKRIVMRIPIYGEELEISGEIIRFYKEGEYFYMGVLFFKTKPDDMQKLEDFLYENIHYQFF